jgi:hypothetical protein
MFNLATYIKLNLALKSTYNYKPKDKKLRTFKNMWKCQYPVTWNARIADKEPMTHEKVFWQSLSQLSGS